MIMPTLALALPLAAVIARVLKESLREAMVQDYVLLARLKGKSRLRLVLAGGVAQRRGADLALTGVQFTFLIGGTVIVERIFGYPGIGNMAIDAVINRDLPLIQGLTLVFGALFILVNMVVDLLVVRLQPAAAPWLMRLSRAPCRTKARRGVGNGCRPARAIPRRRSAAVSFSCSASSRSARPGSRRTIRWSRTSSSAPRRRRASRAPRPAIGSAPTTSAATFSRASSTAHASRCTVAFAASILAAVARLRARPHRGLAARLGRRRDLAAGRNLDGVPAGAAVDPAGRRGRRRASARSSRRSPSSTGRASAASCAPRR